MVLPVRIAHDGSMPHDGQNHALVVVCLNRDQAALEVVVHEGTGLVRFCSCALNELVPV